MYCAAVLDTFSRESDRLVDRLLSTAALVTNVLGMAIQNRSPGPGAIIHSDQGG